MPRVNLSQMRTWYRLWIRVMNGFQVELGLKNAIFQDRINQRFGHRGCKQLLEKAGISAEDLDFIIVDNDTLTR